MYEIRGKYVIAHNGQAILFSTAKAHSDFKGYQPISAGFFSVYASLPISEIPRQEPTLVVSVYGESTSLRLSCRQEEDARIIKTQFGVL